MTKNSKPKSDTSHPLILLRLLVLAQEAQYGYAKAAEETSSSYLKNLFQKYELQRSQYAQNLKRLLSPQGRDLALVSPSTLVHWSSSRSLLEQISDHDVLHETLINETANLQTYQSFLNETLPKEEKLLIEKQVSGIKEAIEVFKTYSQAVLKREKTVEPERT